MALLRLLRLRLLVVVVVAAALLWWGRGLGVREGPVPRPDESPSSENRESPSGEGGASERPATDPGPGRVQGEVRVAGLPEVETGGERPLAEGAAAMVDPPGGDPRPDAEGIADVDRRGAREALVRDAIEADRFDEAWSMLRPGDAHDEVLRDAVRTALDRRVRALEQSLRSGSFHAARAFVATAGRGQLVREALASMAARAHWPLLTEVGGGAHERDAVDPRPEPRLSGRLVRLAAGGAAPARVLEVRGSEATLRVLGPLGVTFPSHPVHELEPDAVSAAEATELGLAALVAGDESAARVWAAIACARGAGRSERLAHLLERLPSP